ncbi:MAG TPA: dihydroorotate dehydrogenase electron transfer subunit [Spirochaetia bacterium]|nr:dihydroorotate dehydrogenase electron transfer subunit [Spirochaetia bacterium]
MKQFSARILSNQNVAQDYYEMRFTWPSEVDGPVPGQFVSARSFGTSDLILRRPFAVSAFDPERSVAAIIYQKRGKATNMLAAKSASETVDLIGPLGNAFPVSEGVRPLLVGGGVGLGPILFFGNWLTERGAPPTVLLGFRTKNYVPSFLADRKRVGFDPVVCTDDGSHGYHGTTLDWLTGPASERIGGFGDCSVYTCGPNAMMAGCSLFCSRHQIPCWVSMEQIMGCGVGACIGCAIPVKGEAPFARVCTEGPVFEGSQIQWEKMR